MGKYRSIQSLMIASALKGITDNQTVTAYKKDCNNNARNNDLYSMGAQI